MIKKILAVLFILACSGPVFSQQKDAVLGIWLNASGEGQIMIYKQGDKYFGKLGWIKNPNDEKGKPKVDARNPDVSMKTRPILGAEILKDIVYQGNGVWGDGTIYDPKTGKTYSCTIKMTTNDKLDIRGFIGISLLGRTEIWQRVN
ncbi:MAG TPA: DUF2147 domain-containing protein [Daejeonella sp.]|nr:DUF2147 domain-containing protein [Daejeonella sp.]